MGTDKKIKISVMVLLILLTVGFIWGNSMLPGEQSSEISEQVKKILMFIIPEKFLQGEIGSYLVRKAAHITEFFFLGLESTLLLHYVLDASFSAPLLLDLLIAVGDETIQYFIDGRGSSVTDVWIDFAGIVTGTALILLIGEIWRGCKPVRNNI